MSNIRISQLPAIKTPDISDADVFPIVDIITDATKKVEAIQLIKYIEATANVSSSISASYAGRTTLADLASTSTTASFAHHAAFADVAGYFSQVQLSDTSSFAHTASYIQLAHSSSLALTASYLSPTATASYAITASGYVPYSNTAGISYTASYLSPLATASYALTASLSIQTIGSATTANYALDAGTADWADLAGQATLATSSMTASYVLHAVSSSYAETSATTITCITHSVWADFATQSLYATSSLTASYLNPTATASYSLTSSFGMYSLTSSNSHTSSYGLYSLTSVTAATASYLVPSATASFATTASHAFSASFAADLLISQVVKILNPVGHVITTTLETNPATWVGYSGTTWHRFGEGMCLIGSGSYFGVPYASGSLGGAMSVTLGAGNIPVLSHTHEYWDTLVCESAYLTRPPVTSYWKDNPSINSSTGLPASLGAGMGVTSVGFDGDNSAFSIKRSTEPAGPGTASPSPVSIMQPYVVVQFWKRIA